MISPSKQQHSNLKLKLLNLATLLPSPTMHRIIIAFTSLVTLAAIAVTAPATHAASPRVTLDLNQEWKIHLGDVIVLKDGDAMPAKPDAHKLFVPVGGTGAGAPGFDDSAWKSVELPYAWQGEQVRRGERWYNGPVWYRKTLRLDNQLKGKRSFLRFKAVSRYAQVYLNGEWLGDHKGAFQAFAFDITDKIKYGGDNLIAVRADASSLDRTIMPLSGDFMVYCGIYRGVELIHTAPLHITPLDDGSSGVYIKPERVAANRATYQVAVEVANGSVVATDGQALVEVRDATGELVTTGTTDFSIRAGVTQEVVVKTTLTSPHLWNGKIDPYLYELTVSLREGGKVTDALTENLGVRFFRLDNKTGTFFLNGAPYDLHGVAIHQDFEDRCWALRSEDYLRNIELINEIGATCLRCAHYPHARETYDLCDRSGLIVWAENGNVDWCKFDDPAYTANFKQQTTELVKQNYNHPSICFWSLQNEVGLGNDKDPVVAKQKQATNLSGFVAMDAMVRELDPSFTAASTRVLASGGIPVAGP